MATENDTLRRTVDDILATLPTAKKASAKSASDPKTTHPSGSAPDGNTDTSMGAPGRETESTLKKDEPLGVPHATPSPAEPVDDDTQLGIQAKPLGKDPSVEDDYKGVKDDPGTSLSPASTENSAGRAGKYASLIENLNKSAQAVLLGIDAEIKAAGTAPAPTPAAPAAPAAPAPVAKAAGEADPEGEKAAAAAGEDLATILLGSPLSAEKRAATEQAMVAKVASCIQYGELLAEDYAAYLQVLSDTLQKSANEEAAMAASAGGAPPGMPPEGEPGAGGPPPEGGAGGGGDEAAIMAMLQGGQGMPPVSLEQLLASGGGEGSNPEIEALIQAVLAQEGGGEGEEGMAPPTPQAKAAAQLAGRRKAAAILSKQSEAARRMFPVVKAVLRELART